jgi:choloylglycine hydrolase
MRLLFFFLFTSLFACTDFVVIAKDGSLVNGRSLEFAQDLKAALRVFPRNQRLSSGAPQNGKGVEWTSKYGYLGVTPLGMDFSFDGMNEKGLSFGHLWLPGVTQYQTVPEDRMNQALDFTDLGAWLLGNFATVAEVKEGLKKIFVWGHVVPQIGMAPIHVALHDATGKHLVIEFIGGEMKVYDNPISVLTNSPPFDWQMMNLQNYLNLNAANAPEITFRGVALAPPGQGSGFLGLPGDFSPPSRFVKIATYLRFAKEAANGKEGVNLAEHLLNSVDIPLGEVREKGKETGDYTQWVVIKDLTQQKFYFRSYSDLSLKMIDMKKINFDKVYSKLVKINSTNDVINISFD